MGHGCRLSFIGCLMVVVGICECLGCCALESSDRNEHMANFVISNEKTRDGVVMLLNCLHSLCAFPNMVIDVNIARKSGKKEQT